MSKAASPSDYEIKTEARKYGGTNITVVFYRNDAYLLPDKLVNAYSYKDAQNKAVNRYHYAIYKRTDNGSESVSINRY